VLHLALPQACTEHHLAVCQAIKTAPVRLQACRRDDELEPAYWRQRSHQAIEVQRCHAGLLEARGPLWDGDELCGMLLVGAGRDAATPTTAPLAAAPAARLHGVGNCRDALHLLRLLLEPLLPARRAALNRRSERGGPVAGCLELLQANSRIDLSLTAVAVRLGYSASRLQHLLVEQTGQSFRQHRLQRSLRRAAEELCADDRPIAAIARERGYRSAAAFTAAFREHFGLTPSQYRQRQHQGAMP